MVPHGVPNCPKGEWDTKLPQSWSQSTDRVSDAHSLQIGPHRV
ncbi:hypothetical protein EMEDMD4_1260003 [Sinorhizobium medicae]|uniref:Uncharacterized protein n=1 Tax=Sinorhizobium medicae TaxID=110321 RepID=A0A508WQK6_9HYPH|nr:hypothetical protein EMEDMD4_1260003 [Sinorhizobium medicae]